MREVLIDKKIRAVPKKKAKYLFLLCLLFILLVVGCSKDQEDMLNNELENNQEGIRESDSNLEQNTDNNSDIDTGETVILPLKREDKLSGGIEVITPSGQDFKSIAFEVVGDVAIASVELLGTEFRRTYDVILDGTASIKSNLNIYLIDNGLIGMKSLEEISEEELKSVAFDTLSVEVDGDFSLEDSLTNSVQSSKKTMIYIVIEAEMYEKVKVESLSVKRHVGEAFLLEEFDYEGLPKEELWDYELGGNGWGNGEAQYYNGKDLDNSKVTNGNLVITAIEETVGNNEYTSARIRSKEAYQYGRYEISAKLPMGRGTWPAIWMLPAGNNYGNWPNSGEIDIMEHVGFDMDVVHGSLHMAEFNFRKNNHPTSTMTIPKVDETFHTYVLEWTPYQIDMYIDGYHYMSFKNDGQGPKHWPFDESFYLILNIAVGGAWGAIEGIDSVFPQELTVDYIRGYHLEDEVIDSIAPQTLEEVIVNVQGSVLDINFAPVEDNYKVAYYQIDILDSNGKTIKSIDTTKLNYLLVGLDENKKYVGKFSAVDESGNQSEPYSLPIQTQESTINLLNQVVTPEGLLFAYVAKVKEEEGLSIIQGFEKDSLIGYAFDISETGAYKLEIEASAKLFDGEVMLLDENMEELVTLIIPKTGDVKVFNKLVTETFPLTKGVKTLFIKTVKNGYNIKDVQLIKN